ncbi:MAG: sulfite exporter TauE/SafE family protein [Sedimentisphaerales bacterium]|nr:sulfite exporter TauE/SafE family protein [Sedimentisphaerales bacterium]
MANINALLITAASIGFIHTLLGPDHYLPFVMISWARKWSGAKTFIITFLCGVGHVVSSVVIGLFGVALGIAVGKLENIESARGGLAAWLLIGFGIAYFIWGLRAAYRNQPHRHIHFHPPGLEHEHEHDHHEEHTHIHEQPGKANITPWVLFIIFAFGPCEPLIPILMYPAAQNSISGMLLVTAVFAAATIGTMLVVVMLARNGVKLLEFPWLYRYSHAIAGATIMVCGLAIQFLGL